MHCRKSLTLLGVASPAPCPAPAVLSHTPVFRPPSCLTSPDSGWLRPRRRSLSHPQLVPPWLPSRKLTKKSDDALAVRQGDRAGIARIARLTRQRPPHSLRVRVSGVGLPWRRVLGRGEGKGVLGDSGWLHQDDTRLQRRLAEMRASGPHSPREPVDTLKLQAGLDLRAWNRSCRDCQFWPGLEWTKETSLLSVLWGPGEDPGQKRDRNWKADEIRMRSAF